MTRTKRHQPSAGRAAQKRPSKSPIAKAPLVVVLSPEQKIKRSLGRSALHRGRLPVVMDGTTACCIAKMGRRRMAASVLGDISPTRHMMIRPSITTTTARAIECVIGSMAEKSQGWNSMNDNIMLMGRGLHRAFADYCSARGGVWVDVAAECDMIMSAIDDNKLNEYDKCVMSDYALTDEGIKRREARLVSSKKAQITKRNKASRD